MDDGEHTLEMIQKATPVLVSDGPFDHQNIATMFKEESQHIEEDMSRFVYEKLTRYP